MAALPGAMGREERGDAPSGRVAVDYTGTGRTILMTDDLRGITKLPEEGARWIDEPLRGAIRELRTVLLSRADGGVPAAREAWTEAAQMVVAIMQQHGIEFEEPLPEHVDITPATIERLLDEAELSPGPITPAARAMLAIMQWLAARATTEEPTQGFDRWVQRAATLYDLKIDHSEPVEAQAPPAPDNPMRRD